MDRQCSSCGGFCKKSGCERENVKLEPWAVNALSKKEWVGLTDGEAKRVFEAEHCRISADLAGILARAIEAKLKEKNT